MQYFRSRGTQALTISVAIAAIFQLPLCCLLSQNTFSGPPRENCSPFCSLMDACSYKSVLNCSRVTGATKILLVYCLLKSKAIIQIRMLYNIKIIFSLQHITTSPIKTKTPTKTLEITFPAFCPVLWRNENHCVGTIFYLTCFCMELNSFQNRCKVWVDHYWTVVFSILSLLFQGLIATCS